VCPIACQSLITSMGQISSCIRMKRNCDQAVRNTAKFMGILQQDAVRMASEIPAEILSLSEKGRIRSGADADLVVLSTECIVEESIAAGETVYHGGENHVRKQDAR
jgi:N-acetylglucosamine-6-phosphate deacetylase